MHTKKDQDSTSAVTPSLPGHHSRAAACARDAGHSEPVARAVGGWLLMRWLAGRPRVTGVALVAAGWTATFTAVIAGRHLGRGAAVQIIFAATMVTWVMGETLLGKAVPVIINERALSGERALPGAGRYHKLGMVALVTGCLLGPLAAGAALGTDWATSLLTSLAVACAAASIAAHRLGRHLAPGASRVPVAAIRRRPAESCRTGQLPAVERVRVRGQLEVDHVQP
jgi:hypothetical protein